MKTLSIIPARGGSKELPDKNILPFCGHPLIAWTIIQSLSSELIGRTIVSTDSSKIQKIAEQYGAEAPFLRPSELSDDIVMPDLALVHAIDFLKGEGYAPDFVVMLQATSPIRLPGTIDRGISLLQKKNFDAVLSVNKNHRFIWRNPELPTANYDVKNRPRRQDFKPDEIEYFETGSIYVCRTDVLLSGKNRMGGRIGMLQTSKVESLEIDSVEDFELVQVVAKTLCEKLEVPTKAR